MATTQNVSTNNQASNSSNEAVMVSPSTGSGQAEVEPSAKLDNKQEPNLNNQIPKTNDPSPANQDPTNKSKKKRFLILFSLLVIALGATASGYVLFSSSEDKEESNIEPTPVSMPVSKTCDYEGKTYKEGEGFKASDGCNSCSCSNGKVACTTMACEQPSGTTPSSTSITEPTVDCNLSKFGIKTKIYTDWKCNQINSSSLSIESDNFNIGISDGARGPYCGDGPSSNSCKTVLFYKNSKVTMTSYYMNDNLGEIVDFLSIKGTEGNNVHISVGDPKGGFLTLDEEQKTELIKFFDSINY